MRACARESVPWVARGSGSGLSGGALPISEGVLIVVSRLKRILEIDRDNARVLVEPGVTNASVSAAVAPDFFYPPDPSSQIVCSIGGNVAENSGGAHCFKYGFTTNYVCGLEVVLPDGEMIVARRAGARHAGLRPPRRVRRLRGHARRRDEGVAARRPRARDGQDARRVLRLDPRRGRGGRRDRHERRRAGRDRDDGQARDRGLRADGPRGLPRRPRRGAARRARRRRGRVRGALRGGRAHLRAVRLRRRARRARRGRAPALLEDAQGGVPGDGPHLARTTSSRTASSRARSCPRCSTASTSSRPSTT